MLHYLNNGNYNFYHILLSPFFLFIQPPNQKVPFLKRTICSLMLNLLFLINLLKYPLIFLFLNLMINTPNHFTSINTNLSNTPKNSFINLYTLNIRDFKIGRAHV